MENLSFMSYFGVRNGMSYMTLSTYLFTSLFCNWNYVLHLHGHLLHLENCLTSSKVYMPFLVSPNRDHLLKCTSLFTTTSLVTKMGTWWVFLYSRQQPYLNMEPIPLHFSMTFFTNYQQQSPFNLIRFAKHCVYKGLATWIHLESTLARGLCPLAIT